MRILVLVPQVPTSLDEKRPWHFFQELKPLADSGNTIRVLSHTNPNYTCPGIELRKISRPPLRGNLRELSTTLIYAWKNRCILPSVRRFSDIKSLLSFCQWNRTIQQEIEDFRPDIVHSHWAAPDGSAGYLAAANTKTPLVMTLRGHEHIKSEQMQYGSCLDPFYERTLRLALLQASVITVCCTDSTNRLKELGVDQDDKIITVFHAVNSERFTADAGASEDIRKSLNLEGKRVISCIAIIDHHRKGHATLLKAFRNVHRRFPDTVLLLVGDGPLKPFLQHLANELGISSSIIFVGNIHPTEVQHYFRLSCVTVLPTHCEVFGNVVFESLILGIPVVSGNVGAARDILPRGPIGQTFTPGDAQECEQAILAVLENPSLHQLRAEKGRQFVLDEMSISKRIDGFNKAYEKATSIALEKDIR